MYGTMIKTTVYLPEDLKAALERVATEHRRSEADVIREGIRLAIERATPPLPHFGIFDGGPDDSERVDELLKGFGER
jgi:muconolactone delta-isomerase